MRTFARWSVLGIVLVIAGCGLSPDQTHADAKDAANHMQVFKTPSCGCCVEWVNHLEENGFAATVHHPDDIAAVKQQYGIGLQHQSCHTAVSPSGHVFEGHVPAKFVKRFLDNPPAEAIGLSVPGMPVGSPGMEVEDKFMPYQILLLMADGSATPYAKMQSYEEQFD